MSDDSTRPDGAEPERREPEPRAPEPREAPEAREPEPREPEPREAPDTREPDDSGAPPRPTLRGAARAGGRAITGIAAIAIAVVVAGAATQLPIPDATVPVPRVTVTPVPAAQQLVCPGAVLRLSDDAGRGASTATALGPPSYVTASPDADVTRRAFDDSEAGTGGSAAAPQLVSAQPGAATSVPLVAGAQLQSVASGDYVGLTAAACTPTSGSAWLVGGSTAVGRTTLLALANPTEVTAVVAVRMWGESGEVRAPGMSGVTVPPRGQRVISLAAFGPGISAPVVQVTSRGGQIAASLQQSVVRGLAPGGLDIVGSTRRPATSVVIPGVTVTAQDEVERRAGGDATEDFAVALRVFAPPLDDGGSATATASIRLVPEDGSTTGRTFDVELTPGQPSEVVIDELLPGNYTAVVDADVPVVAAIRASTAVAGGPIDFAWFGSASPLSRPTLLATPQGGDQRLHIANPGTGDAVVMLRRTGGDETRIAVPAGGAVLVPVESSASYVLDPGDASVLASVSVSTPGGVAGYPVAPGGRASAPVVVLPQG